MGHELSSIQYRQAVQGIRSRLRKISQTFLLQRIAGLISLTALVLLIVVPVLGVHQVEIEIIHTAQLQLAFDKRADVLLFVEVRRGQLVGQKEFLSGIALCHTVPDRRFRKAPKI